MLPIYVCFTKLDSPRGHGAERLLRILAVPSAIDARASLRQASRCREDWACTKFQLDQAQREIFRAQELLDSLDAQDARPRRPLRHERSPTSSRSEAADMHREDVKKATAGMRKVG